MNEVDKAYTEMIEAALLYIMDGMPDHDIPAQTGVTSDEANAIAFARKTAGEKSGKRWSRLPMSQFVADYKKALELAQ